MAEEPEKKRETNTSASKAAKELGKLGASKGGIARANTLTPEHRSEIARSAIRARWAREGKLKLEHGLQDSPPSEPPKTRVIGPAPEIPGKPYSMFPGILALGPVTMECHVLSDERRVFTQREMVRVISGGRISGNLQRYLDRNPLTKDGIISGKMIEFAIPGSGDANGYEATLLVDICDLYVEARRQGLLRPSQYKLAEQALAILRACAKIGIVALIDEATGYQQFRAKNALRLKFQAFIADEMQDWARMFPEDFWLQLARLEGIHYSARSRPLRWGKYVMMFVYDAIDKDIGNELRKKNPNPHFLKNHHQWLKKFGRDKVHDQIIQIVTIMKLCPDMETFRKKFAHVFKNAPLQLGFGDIDWKAD